MKKALIWFIISAVLVSACRLSSALPNQENGPATSPPPTSEPALPKPETSDPNDRFAVFREGLIDSQQALLELAGDARAPDALPARIDGSPDGLSDPAPHL